MSAFDVSRGPVGIALSGMWVAYAFSQLPSGVLADWIGERRAILVALWISATATLVLAVAPTFLIFGVGTLALGVGAGFYYNPATALLEREFNRVGWAVGAHRVGGQAAGVSAPLVTYATVRYGWRSTLFLGCLLAGTISLLFAQSGVATGTSRPAGPLREYVESMPLGGTSLSPQERYTTFMAALVEFVVLAAMAYLPTLLIEHIGISTGHANLLFAVFFAIAAVAQPVGGLISDHVGRDVTIAVQMAIGVIGFSLLSIGSSFGTVAVGVVLSGIAMSSVPVIQTRMLDGLSSSDRGSRFGQFRMLYLLVGSLGTTVVGVTADVFGWAQVGGILAGLLAIVFLSLVVQEAAGLGLDERV